MSICVGFHNLFLVCKDDSIDDHPQKVWNTKYIHGELDYFLLIKAALPKNSSHLHYAGPCWHSKDDRNNEEHDQILHLKHWICLDEICVRWDVAVHFQEEAHHNAPRNEDNGYHRDHIDPILPREMFQFGVCLELLVPLRSQCLISLQSVVENHVVHDLANSNRAAHARCHT